MERGRDREREGGRERGSEGFPVVREYFPRTSALPPRSKRERGRKMEREPRGRGRKGEGQGESEGGRENRETNSGPLRRIRDPGV